MRKRTETRQPGVLRWYDALRASSNPAFLPLFFDEHRYLVLCGGGGSGKSIFAGRKVLERLTSEKGHRWLVCRKVDALQNYLYMLMEELRYLLRHLDAENFSDSGLEALAESVAETGSGSISGPAVTPESLMAALYARSGLTADLEAERLRTDWQRALRCLQGNRSDLHYIRIRDGEIEFVTDKVSAPARTVQMKRGDAPCWWTDETRTAIGTEETAWPVMVYVCEETVTAGIRYQTTPRGNYLPVLSFGSGLQSGMVYRDSDGLTVRYTTGEGEDVSLLLSGDGYVDADRMRRPTAYDFRSIADGVIRETVDGGTIISYAVETDALGRIVKLTAADGHETAIRW